MNLQYKNKNRFSVAVTAAVLRLVQKKKIISKSSSNTLVWMKIKEYDNNLNKKYNKQTKTKRLNIYKFPEISSSLLKKFPSEFRGGGGRSLINFYKIKLTLSLVHFGGLELGIGDLFIGINEAWQCSLGERGRHIVFHPFEVVLYRISLFVEQLLFLLSLARRLLADHSGPHFNGVEHFVLLALFFLVFVDVFVEQGSECEPLTILRRSPQHYNHEEYKREEYVPEALV